jgi:integrase
MARAYVAGSGRGWRSLLRAVSALYTVWDHLVERHGDAFPASPRPARMKARLRADWEKVTGENTKLLQWQRKKKFRYDRPELEKLFPNLGAVRTVTVTRGRKHRREVEEVRALCDPRVRLVVEIGAELRPGQVLRAMRSMLDMEHGIGGYGLGRFHGSLVGTNGKPGQDVDLHPEMREHLEHVLTKGYLAELEAAYESGALADYPLFPGGKLVAGRIPLRRVEKHPTRHLSKSQAIAYWRVFESAVGVPHVEGRSFFGLRRGLTDVARDHASDGRVLNNLTGHTNDQTREDYYLDGKRDEDIAAAAVTRRAVRLSIMGSGYQLRSRTRSRSPM